jgi:hyperosmotically inducible periplasmic protein
MSFRLGALLCLSGVVACSHQRTEAARDPSSSEPPADPPMVPASLENRDRAPSSDSDHELRRTPASSRAETKGTQSDEARSNEPTPAIDSPKTSSPPPTTSGAPADNTKVNRRDANSDALTPMDQGNNQRDLAITQQIRKSVMADGTLSFTAKNVKIITQNGKVTLRGPVNTREERAAIEAAARHVAGDRVDNQIEITK